MLIRYRTEHDLTQRELGTVLSMAQPQIARLESGEHNPSIETLVRIARSLNMEMTVSITPQEGEPTLLSKPGHTNAVARFIQDGATVIFSARQGSRRPLHRAAR